MSSDETVHVLCLHGCNQTVEMFQSILKDWIKIGGNSHGLVFHFLEAAYDHPDGGKTWYCRPLEVDKIGSIDMDHDLIRSAMEDLDAKIKEVGASVLLGFSQGGNVVDSYLAHYNKEGLIKRAVLCSTYPLVEDRRPNDQIPIVSVFSEADTIVPPSCRPTAYTEIEEITHSKGHKIVTSKPVIRRICAFMASE